jgi:hypothetical protein
VESAGMWRSMLESNIEILDYQPHTHNAEWILLTKIIKQQDFVQ